MASPQLLRGRFSQVGAYYAITTNADGRRPLFADDTCASIVARRLAGAHYALHFEPLAWVVMPDHVHIVLRLDNDSLSRAIQAFKSHAARAINSARTTTGPVWQAGFYDHCIRTEEDLFKQARYVIENPLRRGLTERLDDYPYWWCRWVARSAL